MELSSGPVGRSYHRLAGASKPLPSRKSVVATAEGGERVERHALAPVLAGRQVVRAVVS